jgi:hypothetical protein
MALIWKVDECSEKDGRMHLRGWCFDKRMPIRKVEVVFSQPFGAIALDGFGLPSPDVAASVGPGAGNSRFDAWIDVPRHAFGCEFRLQFTLSDGTIILGNPVPDGAGRGMPGIGGAGEPEVLRDPFALQAEIEAVRRRESAFAVSMAEEFVDRGERNTYLHTLREERIGLVKRDQEASAGLEALTRKLESELERTAVLERELEGIRGSAPWRLLAPLRAIGRVLAAGRR